MPALLRGAFFTTGQGDTAIDFYVLDETRRVVLNQRKKTEGIFQFNATKPGHYMFIFSNLKVIFKRLISLEPSNKTGYNGFLV